MFSRKIEDNGPQLTAGELAEQHRATAEDLLRRAGKGGRLEAETRWATMATAHATLALYYDRQTDRIPS